MTAMLYSLTQSNYIALFHRFCRAAVPYFQSRASLFLIPSWNTAMDCHTVVIDEGIVEEKFGRSTFF
jgi:hypothetical protein